MSGIWSTIGGILSGLNTPVGFVGSIIGIYDYIKSKTTSNVQVFQNEIRQASQIAYQRYCQQVPYREADLGIPLEGDVLGYLETCLRHDQLPSVTDIVEKRIASQEEAEVLFPYLMEQWMTIPEFSWWLHDYLTQNNQKKLSEQLQSITQMVQAIGQFESQADLRELREIVTLLSPAFINDEAHVCNMQEIKAYFRVNNNFHTMLRVISAGQDVPNQQALQKIKELLDADTQSPIIITGNGGQGKTSLMMRTAVEWVLEGRVAVWLALSNKEIISEQKAHCLFDLLLQMVPVGQRILLCIDNPYEGRESLSSLQTRWPHTSKIQLMLVERANRLSLLTDPDHDLLHGWFDNANVITLHSGQPRKAYVLKTYAVHNFFDSTERRKEILKKSTDYLVQEGAICEQDQTNVINQMLRLYGKPYVGLVELIYRTLFELKKVSSKPESIQLDWDEWGNFIRGEFHTDESNTQLYGIIAALKVLNMPMTVSLFCRFFEIKKRTFGSRLKERFVQRHVEPVIYQEGPETLQPKHDVIADLFFLFHRETASINLFVCDLLDTMDEDEIELFLANTVNKKEVLKGEKHLIGKISYWNYMQLIYDRIQNGTCNLSQDARAYLCMGILWSGSQRHIAFDTVESMVQDIAPEITDNLLLSKLYTEWGIWYAKQHRDALAEDKLLAVITYNPEQIPARTELGRLLSRQKGREDEAEKFLREVIELNAKDIQSRTELGRLLSRQKGREDEAEKLLREAIRIDPKHIQSRTELGRLLSRQKGREDEAEKLLREAIRIDPKNLHPHTELGRLLSRQKGREDEAEKFLREILTIDPKNIQSRTELGRLLSRQKGREDEAEKFLREVIELNAKDIQSRTELGRLLSRQKGREDEAEKFLREAIQIDPKNLHPRTVLARLYEKLGRISEARDLYHELCKIDPGNRFGLEGLARLKA